MQLLLSEIVRLMVIQVLLAHPIKFNHLSLKSPLTTFVKMLNINIHFTDIHMRVKYTT